MLFPLFAVSFPPSLIATTLACQYGGGGGSILSGRNSSWAGLLERNVLVTFQDQRGQYDLGRALHSESQIIRCEGVFSYRILDP